MSRWQLPLWKNGTPLPQTSRSPVVVRFQGVPPGSPLARRLYETLQGEINRFYFKAAQAYSLSPSEQLMLHQPIANGDGHVRYLNNNGQEILQVTVKRELLEELVKKEDFWDWVVVDFEAAVFGHTYDGDTEPTYSTMKLLAKQVTPAPRTFGKQITTGDVATWGVAMSAVQLPVQRYAREDPPIIDFAGSIIYPEVASGDQLIVGGPQKHSLLIDMREFHREAEMIFEVYGGLQPLADDFVEDAPTPDRIGWYTTGADTYWTPGPVDFPRTETYVETYIRYDTAGGNDPNANWELFGVTAPYFDTSQLEPYESNMGSQDGYIDLADPRYAELPAGVWFLIQFLSATSQGHPELEPGVYSEWHFHAGTGHFTFYPVYRTEPQLVPVNPTSELTVKGSTFKGEPLWRWSQDYTDEDVDVLLWQIKSMYPQRFNVVKIADGIPLVAYGSGTLDNNFQLTFLGTLHCFPKSGGVAFKPAT